MSARRGNLKVMSLRGLVGLVGGVSVFLAGSVAHAQCSKSPV
jgi:hypothetical protein